MTDIARILITSTSTEIRREIEKKSLLYYYNTLKKLVEEDGNQLDYNFETVKIFLNTLLF